MTGKGKHLSESQRLEVITGLREPAPPKTKTKQFQASVGQFSELEDMLYIWIDSKRRTSLPLPPSLAVFKAIQIAEQLLISEDGLKASWQWPIPITSWIAENSSPR
ncbi:unnamed protein product [Clavelina lepadiformis]|uniref:Transposase n=1 Tax=Clavelina lepadiformis TaxID=159417 RepID=A0ABP0G9Y0_CLALP